MNPLETAFWQATGITPSALNVPIKTVLSALLIGALLLVVIAGYHTLMSDGSNVLGFLFLILRAGLLISLWWVLIS